MPLGGLVPCPIPLGGTSQDGLTAAQHARICADLIAVVATAPLAWVRGHTGNTSPNVYVSQFDVGLAAAPTVTPNGSGDVSISWESSFTDDFGNSGSLVIRHAEATICGTASPGNRIVTAEIVAPNAIRVRTFTGSSGAATPAAYFVVVY
jgi:hypothetical protein